MINADQKDPAETLGAASPAEGAPQKSVHAVDGRTIVLGQLKTDDEARLAAEIDKLLE